MIKKCFSEDTTLELSTEGFGRAVIGSGRGSGWGRGERHPRKWDCTSKEVKSVVCTWGRGGTGRSKKPDMQAGVTVQGELEWGEEASAVCSYYHLPIKLQALRAGLT